MAVSFDTFDRLKTKGVAAYQNGEYLAAKTYLVDAAECMIELAAAAKTADARRQHEEVAAELIQLAKECDRLHSGGRRGKPGQHGGRGGGGGGPGRAGTNRQAAESDDDGADASDWVIREKPKIGFDDIAGLEDIKEDIRLKMLYPFAHPELAQKYGITVGGGVLLFGPPGTGKTMIAKAVAHEIDATFFLISPAQMLSKWVGEAEQNVRKLFDAAKAEPIAVIFLDEAEALVPKRQSEGTSVMQRVVPQILQELEGFDRQGDRALLFMAATNQPWLLDEAMLRP
ncbi:MAG: ATP-binding protein [Planctomycetota bacterium]